MSAANKTPKSPRRPARHSLRAAPGSGRRCQWLMELKGWNDCGRPATHIRSGCGLAYCADHARLMMPYASFQPIAPNIKAEPPPVSGGEAQKEYPNEN